MPMPKESTYVIHNDDSCEKVRKIVILNLNSYIFRSRRHYWPTMHNYAFHEEIHEMITMIS